LKRQSNEVVDVCREKFLRPTSVLGSNNIIGEVSFLKGALIDKKMHVSTYHLF
jgi:hypothetical protein